MKFNRDLARKWSYRIVVILLLLSAYLLLSKKCESDAAEEERIMEAANELVAKGDSCALAKNTEEALAYYNSSYKMYVSDNCIAKILYCRQALGQTDTALLWLNKLEENIGKTIFTELRRANIYLQSGDTTVSVRILDSLLAYPLVCKKCWFGRTLIDMFLYSDKNYTKAENHYQYYFNYLGKLLALNTRLNLEKDSSEYFDMGHLLFQLVEDRDDDYEIMNGYLETLGSKWYTTSFEKNMNILYACNLYVGFSTILKVISDFKWGIFNNLLIKKHINDGYASALEYVNRITDNNEKNTDAYANYHKYLYGIYLGASENERFPSSLTVEEIDSILEKSVDRHNRLKPALIAIAKRRSKLVIDSVSNKINEVYVKTDIRGDKIVEPIMILGCNEWNCLDTTILVHDFIAQNKDKRKYLRYINNNFKACESYTDEEQFNLIINMELTNTYVLNLLEAEYGKQRQMD